MQRQLQAASDLLPLLFTHIQCSGATRNTLPKFLCSSTTPRTLQCFAFHSTPASGDLSPHSFKQLDLQHGRWRLSLAWSRGGRKGCQSSQPWGRHYRTISEQATAQARAPTGFACLTFAAQCCRTLTTSGAVSGGFDGLNVSADLQERLAALGITDPLPVQEAAVPAILAGHNVAIKSCTGSGKTLAYLLPIIQLALERRQAAVAALAPAATTSTATAGGVDASPAGQQLAVLKQQARSLQALVVAPSRELCIQIQRTAQILLPPYADRRLVQQLIGGANPKRQTEALAGRDGAVWPLLAVGTPGRVAEFLGSGKLHVWGCPQLVLDEVDQLLTQPDTRSHMDAICDHVGRRVPRSDPHSASASDASGAASSHTLSRPARYVTIPAGASSSGQRGGGASASCGGAVGGRQTVIVSASLDGRDLSKYTTWCSNPTLVMLGSNQALPRRVLQIPQPADSRAEESGMGLEGMAAAAGGDNVEAQVAVTGHEVQTREASSVVLAREPSGTDGTQMCGPPVHAQPSDADRGRNDMEAGPLSGVLQPHLAHTYVVSPSQHRTDHVRRLIHALGLERVLLFVPKQSQAMVTKYRLEARKMPVTILHGQLSKLERGNILDAFRRGVFRTLVVTDLGARGLDLPDCDAVINFGVPTDALAYAHRAGRTGRAGAPGVVASVVSKIEVQPLQRIARRLGLRLQAVALAHGTIAPGEDTATAQGAADNVLAPRGGPATSSKMHAVAFDRPQKM